MRVVEIATTLIRRRPSKTGAFDALCATFSREREKGCRALSPPPAPATTAANQIPPNSRTSTHGRAPVHLSHAGPFQDLARRQEGVGEHPSLLLPRRQDRRARRQRFGQVDAAAHHGRHRYRIRRRRLPRRGRSRRLPPAGAAARSFARRARQRHAGRRRQAGDSRSLQRTRDELFGRERGRDDAAAGRDRVPGAVGSRQPGRTGDGRLGLPARRFQRRHALRRRAPPRRAVQAPARKAGPAAAGRADEPSRRRDGQLAGRALAQLSRRDPHRHPRSLLPRQRDRLDPRARSRQGHPLRGQLLRLAQAEAEAAAAGAKRGHRAPARARRGERVDRRFARRRGRPNRRRASPPTRNWSRSRTTRRRRPRRSSFPSPSGSARTSSTSPISRRALATGC